jgi:hypothetical protein
MRAKWLNVGSHVVFVGYFKDTGAYLVKGWLKVGEIISYVEALERFPTRENVILRVASPKSVNRQFPAKWKRRYIRQQVEKIFGQEVPQFLTFSHSHNQ